eukprot:symbB.v1.2.024518.t1/scaffold2324.1/size158529/6
MIIIVIIIILILILIVIVIVIVIEDEDLTEIDLELASTPSSLTLAEQTARVDVDEPVKVMQVLIQPKKRKGPSAEKEKRVRFLAAQGGA